MTAFIGIDYGTKYIGLSWGTSELGMSVPLPAIIHYSSYKDLFVRLGKLIKEKGCDAFVVGLPLHMDGQMGKRVHEVQNFSNLLEKHFQLPIHFFDERLSTQAAQNLISVGKQSLKKTKQQKRSGCVDSQAASIILQDFLDTIAEKSIR